MPHFFFIKQILIKKFSPAQPSNIPFIISSHTEAFSISFDSIISLKSPSYLLLFVHFPLNSRSGPLSLLPSFSPFLSVVLRLFLSCSILLVLSSLPSLSPPSSPLCLSSFISLSSSLKSSLRFSLESSLFLLQCSSRSILYTFSLTTPPSLSNLIHTVQTKTRYSEAFCNYRFAMWAIESNCLACLHKRTPINTSNIMNDSH